MQSCTPTPVSKQKKLLELPLSDILTFNPQDLREQILQVARKRYDKPASLRQAPPARQRKGGKRAAAGRSNGSPVHQGIKLRAEEFNVKAASSSKSPIRRSRTRKSP